MVAERILVPSGRRQTRLTLGGGGEDGDEEKCLLVSVKSDICKNVFQGVFVFPVECVDLNIFTQPYPTSWAQQLHSFQMKKTMLMIVGSVDINETLRTLRSACQRRIDPR